MSVIPDSAGEGGAASAILFATLLALCVPMTAPAAEDQAERWQYELVPYFWAAGMKGDVQSGNLPKTSVDMSFSDIWDNLDFGAMGTFEGRKGRWGFLFDAIYMKISSSATSSRTGPGPIGATATATADLKLEQTMLAAAATYRVHDGPTAVDVVGGLRYTKIDADANINASLFGLTGYAARSGSKNWTDPYVGARVQHRVSGRWTLVGYADIGGFNVGSDLSWQALAGASYDFSKTVSGKFGYRYISADYDKNGFLYDMDSYGLYVGVGFKF